MRGLVSRRSEGGGWSDPGSLPRSGVTWRRLSEADAQERGRFCDAVGPAADIHTRMPIALPKDAEADWLDPEMTDAAAVIQFARERAVTEFVHDAVNPRVNNARNEGAEFIEPFENPV
jgi:SOS response associated peptidase (SRAP)